MFGVMQHLNIENYKTVQEAPIYREGFKAIEIEKAVVVQLGTEGGNSTCDLVLVDKEGQHFVVMLTGNLIKTLAAVL